MVQLPYWPPINMDNWNQSSSHPESKLLPEPRRQSHIRQHTWSQISTDSWLHSVPPQRRLTEGNKSTPNHSMSDTDSLSALFHDSMMNLKTAVSSLSSVFYILFFILIRFNHPCQELCKLTLIMIMRFDTQFVNLSGTGQFNHVVLVLNKIQRRAHLDINLLIFICLSSGQHKWHEEHHDHSNAHRIDFIHITVLAEV